MQHFLLALFAQSEGSTISGSGWAGAGLLGLVLGWLLLRHLPQKDAQLDKLLADHAARLKEREDMQDARLKEREDAQDLRLREKDELLKQMLATKNAQLQQMIASQEATQKLMHAQNRESLDSVILHCKDEMSAMATRLDAQNELLEHSIAGLTEAIMSFQAEIRHGVEAGRWLPAKESGGGS